MNLEEIKQKLGGKIEFSSKTQDLNDKNAEYFVQV